MTGLVLKTRRRGAGYAPQLPMSALNVRHELPGGVGLMEIVENVKMEREKEEKKEKMEAKKLQKEKGGKEVKEKTVEKMVEKGSGKGHKWIKWQVKREKQALQKIRSLQIKVKDNLHQRERSQMLDEHRQRPRIHQRKAWWMR